MGCSEIGNIDSKTSISLNLNINSLISKSSSSRNALGDDNAEYELVISLYDVKNNSTFDKSKARLVSSFSQKNIGEKISASFKDVLVGMRAVIDVELYEKSVSGGKTLAYYGKSDIFKVKTKNNFIQIQLDKLIFNFLSKKGEKDDIPVETGGSYLKTEEYIQVTVDNPEKSESEWSYYVKSVEQRAFHAEKNYTVSVDLKADEKTVVAISANRADMYFTVGTDWETFSFETGLIQMEEISQISIGCGLSNNTYIRNLKIEEYTSNLPTLSFNIETEGIQEYLNSDIDEPILQVKKVFEGSKELGHELKLNSKGVTFQVRGYGIANTLNVANFQIQTENEGLFSAPEKVDTDFSSNYADAWTEGTEITPNKYNEYAVYFPLYTEEIEDFENIESTSANNQNLVPCAIEGFLQEYWEVPEHPIYIKSFGISSASSLENKGKTFAIKVDDSFSKSYELPFYADVKISSQSEVVFDVLLANDFNQDDTGVQINWTDCTRFLYNGESEIEGKLQFIIDNDEEGNPIFKLKNISGDDFPFQINLTTDLKVEILFSEY